MKRQVSEGILQQNDFVSTTLFASKRVDQILAETIGGNGKQISNFDWKVENYGMSVILSIG